MPIESYKLGPGSLTFDDGTPFDLSLQVTGCKIVPSETVQTADAVKVLGGGELPAEDTTSYRYAISGSVLQDISATGVIAWTWDHEGEFVDFVFVPSTAEGRQAAGRCRIIPLQFGGDDIEGRPQAEFEYVCEAKPTLGPIA
jgi:hypothetical protein